MRWATEQCPGAAASGTCAELQSPAEGLLHLLLRPRDRHAGSAATWPGPLPRLAWLGPCRGEGQGCLLHPMRPSQASMRVPGAQLRAEGSGNVPAGKQQAACPPGCAPGPRLPAQLPSLFRGVGAAGPPAAGAHPACSAAAGEQTQPSRETRACGVCCLVRFTVTQDSARWGRSATPQVQR